LSGARLTETFPKKSAQGARQKEEGRESQKEEGSWESKKEKEKIRKDSGKLEVRLRFRKFGWRDSIARHERALGGNRFRDYLKS
jgi:hypothetical protein